jgi:hypothetical protein
MKKREGRRRGRRGKRRRMGWVGEEDTRGIQ